MKIIILNGPPGCGKDTLADATVKYFGNSCQKLVFAYPLKQANKIIYSLTDTELHEYETNRQLKEAPQDRFFGKSWRQVNIDLAEKYLKIEHGKFALGKLLVYRIQELIKANENVNFIISDCGFIEEVTALLEQFLPTDITIIQIYRDGHNFNTDSRNYIGASHLGIKTLTLHNNTDKQKFEQEGLSIIEQIIG